MIPLVSSYWWESGRFPTAFLEDQSQMETLRLSLMLNASLLEEESGVWERVRRASVLLESCYLRTSETPKERWQEIALIHEAVGIGQPTSRAYEWLLSSLCWQISQLPAIASFLASKIPVQDKDAIEKLVLAYSRRDFLQLGNLARQAILEAKRTLEAEDRPVAGPALALMQRIVGNYMLGLSDFVMYREDGLPDVQLMLDFVELARIFGPSRYYRVGRLLHRSVSIFEQSSARLVLDQLDSLSERANEQLRRYLRQFPELWPSQLDSIQKGLLDPKKKYFVVAVPTSSGKTLCGELAMLQHLADNPSGVCFYVVPTRALVQEKSSELARRLTGFGVLVTGATSALQHDATTEADLLRNSGVIVCTPEKLDLLIRHEDDKFRAGTLFIIDETHLISDDDRGLGLEFVVVKLLLLKPASRIILLSAMLPNSEDFGRWLAEDAEVSSIAWKPTRQRFGEVSFEDIVPHGSRLALRLYNDEDDILINLHDYSRRPRPVLQKLILTIDALKEKWPILVFSMSKGRCETIVEHIVAHYTAEGAATVNSESIEQLRTKIGREISEDFLLRKSLKYGVAYHHGDLPPRIRIALEKLIERGEIKVLISTTTLAEGVNLPISTVLFEDWMTHGDPREQRQPEPLDLSKFRNISGRAGRPGKESEGLILFLEPSRKLIAGEHPRDYFIRKKYPPIQSRFLAIVRKYDLPTDDLLDEAWIKGDGGWNPEVRYALRQFGSTVLHAIEVLNAEEVSVVDQVVDRSLLAVQSPKSIGKAKRWFKTWADFYDRVELSHKELRLIAMQVGLPLRAIQNLYNRTSESTGLGLFLNTGKMENSGLSDEQLRFATDLVTSIEELDWNPATAPHGDLLRAWINGETVEALVPKYSEHLDRQARALEQTCNYTTQRLSNSGAWGMYALVRVLGLMIGDERLDPAVNNLPLFSYYGVNSKPAILLCLKGIERIDALRLGDAFPRNGLGIYDFETVSKWAQKAGLEKIIEVIRGQDGRDLDHETLSILKVTPIPA